MVSKILNRLSYFEQEYTYILNGVGPTPFACYIQLYNDSISYFDHFQGSKDIKINATQTARKASKCGCDSQNTHSKYNESLKRK